MIKQSAKKKKTDLSIVLICYNMQREIIRTIQSFLPPYQIGVEDKIIEIIVIDNGSDTLPDLSQFKDQINFVHFKSNHPSPVEAVNHGIKLASADLIGVLIDGARMVTPGLCRDVIEVNETHERVFISTLAFHLGPDVQMHSVFEGYNQELEDKLLEEIDWLNNGYNLYLASSLALSSINGLHGSIAESNAIFMEKTIWQELAGYEEKFVSIGGGLSNLDVYKRACELKGIKLVRIANEATFHQVHGGVATNSKLGKYNEIFDSEYRSIRGESFVVSDKIPELYGGLLPQVEYFFSSLKETELSQQYNNIQKKLNKILTKNNQELSFNSSD